MLCIGVSKVYGQTHLYHRRHPDPLWCRPTTQVFEPLWLTGSDRSTGSISLIVVHAQPMIL
jgi:hypothetical protein